MRTSFEEPGDHDGYVAGGIRELEQYILKQSQPPNTTRRIGNVAFTGVAALVGSMSSGSWLRSRKGLGYQPVSLGSIATRLPGLEGEL